MRRPVWLISLLSCIGILCFVALLSVTLRSDTTTLEDCALDGENADFSCNEGGDDDDTPLPDAQNYSRIACCTPFSTLADQSDAQLLYRGVSLSGGELTKENAAQGKFMPFDNDAALFLYKGMNTFRISITWEYFADRKGVVFVRSKYVRELDAVISGLIAKKANVIIDLHNYGRYNADDLSKNKNNRDYLGDDVIRPCTRVRPIWCAGVATSSFSELWYAIASRYNASGMIYGILNEPHDIFYENLNELYILAYGAIRRAENATRHLILIAGNQRTALSEWFVPNAFGRSNADNTELLDILRTRYDPFFAIDVHQYFDNDFSGNYQIGECLPLDIFEQQFDTYWPQFKEWATTNKCAVFIGEFGIPDTPRCRATMNHFLDSVTNFSYLQERDSGVIGWTVWVAGNSLGDHPLSLAPGGPANALMWTGNDSYQKYLVAVATPIPTLANETKSLAIRNDGTEPLRYHSGYLPFQFQGSADILPGQVGYLYSNNAYTTPVGDGGLQISYYKTRRANVFGFGMSVPDPLSEAYSFPKPLPRGISIRNFSVGCEIKATGPTASSEDEPRCYVVS